MDQELNDLADLAWQLNRVKTFIDKGKILPKQRFKSYYPFKRSPFERAWERVNIVSLDPQTCWTWSGSNTHGYGQVRQGSGAMGTGRLIRVARLVFHVLIAPIATGFIKEDDKHEAWVSHKCKEPSCCRPSHLRLVATQEWWNVHAHNLSPVVYGEEAIGSKLTNHAVEQIRVLRTQGCSPGEIFRKGLYRIGEVPSVNLKTIQKAVYGNTFKNITVPKYPKVMIIYFPKNIGSKNAASKLSEQNVAVIKKLLSFFPETRRHNSKIIAARLGVKWKTILNVMYGVRWKHVS